MINVILLLIIFVCLNKWFYHTVIVLALWWQVLNNLYLQPYSFTGVCALLIAICFIRKIIRKEILWNSFPLRIPFLILFICYCVSVFNGGFNIDLKSMKWYNLKADCYELEIHVAREMTHTKKR